MSDHSQEESTEHFFTSFTDLLVGVIFLFMLLLMVFALNLKNEAPPKIITEEIRAALLRTIAERMEARGLPVTIDLGNGILRLPAELLFESGQWKLTQNGQVVVTTLSQVLGEVLPCAASTGDTSQCGALNLNGLLDSVLIEGHTDNRPFTSVEGYGNWELSAFRAIDVYKTMVASTPALENSITNRNGQPIVGVSAYADTRPTNLQELDPNRRIDLRFTMRSPDYHNVTSLGEENAAQ